MDTNNVILTNAAVYRSALHGQTNLCKFKLEIYFIYNYSICTSLHLTKMNKCTLFSEAATLVGISLSQIYCYQQICQVKYMFEESEFRNSVTITWFAHQFFISHICIIFLLNAQYTSWLELANINMYLLNLKLSNINISFGLKSQAKYPLVGNRLGLPRQGLVLYKIIIENSVVLSLYV